MPTQQKVSRSSISDPDLMQAAWIHDACPCTPAACVLPHLSTETERMEIEVLLPDPIAHLCRVKAAFRVPHVTQQIIQGVPDNAGVLGLLGGLEGGQIRLHDLGVVVEPARHAGLIVKSRANRHPERIESLHN